MTDSEYYQATKDDDDEWGEPVPAPRSGRPGSRRMGSMVSVRLSAEEAGRLRLAAEAAGLSLSGFLRDAALGKAVGEFGRVPTWVGSEATIVQRTSSHVGTQLAGGVFALTMGQDRGSLSSRNIVLSDEFATC